MSEPTIPPEAANPTQPDSRVAGKPGRPLGRRDTRRTRRRGYEHSVLLNRVYTMMIGRLTPAQMAQTLEMSERHAYRLIAEVEAALQQGAGGPFLPDSTKQLIADTVAKFDLAIGEVMSAAILEPDKARKAAMYAKMADINKQRAEFLMDVGVLPRHQNQPTGGGGGDEDDAEEEIPDEELDVLLKEHYRDKQNANAIDVTPASVAVVPAAQPVAEESGAGRQAAEAASGM